MTAATTDNGRPRLVKKFPSPCVGLCSVSLGDQVCRGCKRFEEEVQHWNTKLSAAQREAVERRLSTMLARVVANAAKVTDEALLRSHMERHGAFYSRHRDPKCWVWDVLRIYSDRIESTEDYGFVALPRYLDLSPRGLYEVIDTRFYALASAYFHRWVETAGKRGKSAQ